MIHGAAMLTWAPESAPILLLLQPGVLNDFVKCSESLPNRIFVKISG